MAEQPDVLERARDAEAERRVDRHAGEVRAVEQDPARRSAEEAGDEVDGRALARAVRADEAEDLAFRDGEVEAVDGADAAEVPGRGLELEHRHSPEEPLEARERRRVEQAARAQVHREHDQRAEEEVAPVAEEAQALDQEALDEDHGGERAEHARESAEDRVGDGEGRRPGC